MKLSAALLLLPLLLSTPAISQTNEAAPGSPYKGVKRIYVDTGGDSKSRDKIVKKIARAKTGVEILESPDGAELVLAFKRAEQGSVRDVKITPPPAVGQPMRTRTIYQATKSGEATVYVPLEGGERRVLATWSGGPAEKFASFFVTKYRQANGLK